MYVTLLFLCSRVRVEGGKVLELHPYALVGVVMHSGQASAGRYYIRERLSWFKFNDTSIFDITDESLKRWGVLRRVLQLGEGGGGLEESKLCFSPPGACRPPSRGPCKKRICTSCGTRDIFCVEYYYFIRELIG